MESLIIVKPQLRVFYSLTILLDANHPISATELTAHHDPPTTPPVNPSPYQWPLTMGPMVLKADDTTWPIPCTALSAEGRGAQLFSRTMAAGRAKVRAVTCNERTTAIESHTRRPPACEGGKVEEGTIER